VAGIVIAAATALDGPGGAAVPGGDGLGGQVLEVLQGCLRAEADGRVWCVTEQAVSAGPGDFPPDPAQAAVWGLGRVAALEHPGVWGGLVDVPAGADAGTLARAVAWLGGDQAAGDQPGEDQVAVRAGGSWVRRIGRPAPFRPAPAWRLPGGTVLVTGGTGALGGHVARWAAGQGADGLVLVSRSGPHAAAAAILAAGMAAAGTGVQVTACDSGDRAQLSALFAGVGPLAGVFHTAGVALAAEPVEGIATASWTAQFAAKAAGATWLDELTAGHDLAAFVVFSSIAGVWGSGGQAAYAAANAAADAVIARRRARGRAATGVAWGPWAGGGMASGETGAQLARRGLTALEPAAALAALGDALAAGEPLPVIADVDWSRFAPAYTARRPSALLAGLPEAARQPGETSAHASEPGATAGSSELIQRLAPATPREQDQILLALVRNEAAIVLGHGGPDMVQPQRGFLDLGFDSLLAVELSKRLAGVTGLRLPSTLIFDFPTAAKLAEHLRAELIRAQLIVDDVAGSASVLAEISKLEGLLSALPPVGADAAQVLARLEGLLTRYSAGAAGRGAQEEPILAPKADGELESANSDEIFEIIKREFGKS
jgi:NAD(P)-dependent dehydrogenase (short-subunit alcohol dehydrogenase family)